MAIPLAIDSLSDLAVVPEIGKEIKAVVFDFGGTLDTDGDHWSQVILDAYKAAGLDVGVDDFVNAYIFAERTLEANGTINRSDSFRDVLQKKIMLQRSHLGLDFDVDPIVDYCYAIAKQTTRKASFLLSLLSKKAALGIVSNFYGNLERVAEEFNIRSHFIALIDSTVEGIRKPDPAIFSLALQSINRHRGENGPLLPGELLMVGDSMKNDIIPARQLGFQTILLTGRPYPPLSCQSHKTE